MKSQRRPSSILLLCLALFAGTLCSCGSSEGEGVSCETVAARGLVNGRGPAVRLGGMSAKREVSQGTPSPGIKAAAGDSVEWAMGTARLYPEEFAVLPKAPAGFKPVYISHYGRHGSRYLVDPGQYGTVYSVLANAAADGKLKPEGEKLWQLYSSVYPSFHLHEGELTPLGAAQHRGIATRMVQRFPQLFRRGCRVEANSTNLERTMLSMQYFSQSLLSLRPGLQIHADASRSYQGRINQHMLENPRATEYDIQWKKGTGLWRPAFDEYAAGLIDPEPFCRRLVTDYGYLTGICDPLGFVLDFFDVAVNLPSCGMGYGLMDAFTQEEQLLLGRLDNYRFYVSKSRWPGYDRRACYLSESVLGDIIDRTAEDLADGVTVRLRFGHDGCMMALFAMLRLPGWDAELADPAEAWKVWDVSQIPMASNLQLVLFRGRSGDLIFLPLLNEVPVAFPLEDLGNHYYRWSDFVAYSSEILREAREGLSCDN